MIVQRTPVHASLLIRSRRPMKSKWLRRLFYLGKSSASPMRLWPHVNRSNYEGDSFRHMNYALPDSFERDLSIDKYFDVATYIARLSCVNF